MSTFDEVLAQIIALLQREGRLAYRALKLRFGIDDEYLAALKEELIDAKRVAADEDGKVLVWTGAAPVSSFEFRVSSSQSPAPSPQPLVPSPWTSDPRRQTLDPRPVTYTPPHLAERIRAEQAALEARSGTDGERKTITALFADLKGSTALIEDLDPEEARAIIDPALQLMMDAVHRYEGYVAQALGDGIFALFGAPIAHEDHPQRALYAALRMQEEMRRYGDILRTKGYPPLLMRVGVNTGEVVVRSIRKDDLHTDYVPVGHSTNLAARMEQLAAPGSILVSEHTHRLTEGYFEFRALGATQIKGVESPLNVYEVLGAGPLRTRLQVAARRGLTRFVGRQSELEQMQQALTQTKAGHGQIVGVMGEPGLGKSRLFYEFKLLSQSGCLILEAYSVSHGKASPYLPLIELLKSYFQLQLQDDERSRRQKIIGRVLELDRSLEDTLSYLFALLGVEEQPSPLQQMDPQIRRRRTFEALKKLFFRESLKQPLILIFEDLHWIDSETQGFLDTFSEGVASAKILLLVNYRPEYRSEWGQKTYYTQLRLAPFGKAEAEEFLDVLLGTTVGARHASPLHDLKQMILEKTEGTPFFMEEVVQTLVEDGTLSGEHGLYHLTQHALTWHLPTTVQGVLAARIDRLASEEKALLQQLAVIGRAFPLGLARHVISQPEEELYRLLASLQRKEFLYEQPAFPEVEYLFKHALTQEVAYNSVLIERRKGLHEQTAQAIEQIYHDRLEEHYSELAYHYQRSGSIQKAVDYLQLAGQQATHRSANIEAVGHFTSALELLKTLPDTPKRTQQELTLQLALGPALGHSKGYTIPEVEQIYTRARELSQHIGESAQLFPIVLGLRTFYHLRGQLQTARELGEQLLDLAQKGQNQAFLMIAHRALGATLCSLGELGLARAHLEQSLALYDSQQHRYDDVLFGQASGVLGRGYLAWTLWSLGYPAQALEKIHGMFTLTQELSRPINLGAALGNAIALHIYRREGHAVQERAEALITLCTEQGTPSFLQSGFVGRGWALAEQGQWEEGIAQIHQGFALANDIAGAWSLQRPLFLALLADSYGKVGNVEEGFKALAEALTIVDKSEERHYEAELHRLKGELTLQQSKTSLKQVADKSQIGQGKSEDANVQILNPKAQSEAEACFLKAIEIARKQHAKSLELRATVSLARLWQQQGKQAEAHQMLSDIYNWFTEGFDTKDLQDATELLAELA